MVKIVLWIFGKIMIRAELPLLFLWRYTWKSEQDRSRSYFFIEKSAIDSVVDSSELNQYNILNTHEELWFLKMRYRKTSNSPENILTITLSDTIKIKISER